MSKLVELISMLTFFSCGVLTILLHAYYSIFYHYSSILFIILSMYLTWYEVFLTNIGQSHPGAKELLKKGGIAVARSLIPGALSAVDKTMEETFMKFAKSQGKKVFCICQFQIMA